MGDKLTWTANGPAGIELQMSSDLSDVAGWKTAPVTPVLNNGVYEVPLKGTASQAFYRLYSTRPAWPVI